MLAIDEIMVGDWVYITDYPMRKEAKQVKPEHFLRSLVIFEPIPLTPAILEKNCFYSVNECIFETPISEEDLIRLIHVDKGWTVDAQIYAKGVNIGYGYFKYVHELQHALKLCGIEKEIIL